MLGLPLRATCGSATSLGKGRIRKRKTAKGMVAGAAQLDKLIEVATVDCYSEEQQASEFFAMIEEKLTSPFFCDPRRSRCQWSR